MTGLLSLAAALLVAAAPPSLGVPAPVAEPQAMLGARMELIVVETADCRYCSLFRRMVLPAYERSPQTRELPIRFIEAAALEGSGIALSGPVDVVPTAILMRDGVELGRISGYVGRENFFRSINHLIAAPR